MFCCLGMVVSSPCKKSQLGTPGCRFALHLGSQMLKKILRCNQGEHHKVSLQMGVCQEGFIEPYFLLKGGGHWTPLARIQNLIADPRAGF